jgi:hypothetical protein
MLSYVAFFHLPTFQLPLAVTQNQDEAFYSQTLHPIEARGKTVGHIKWQGREPLHVLRCLFNLERERLQ